MDLKYTQYKTTIRALKFSALFYKKIFIIDKKIIKLFAC